MDFCEILITREAIVAPLPTDASQDCGAVIDFYGIVRPMENGRRIDGIDYEAHPRMAEAELQAIVSEAARDPALRACRIVHRIGFVPAGGVSLFLRVASPHRDAAYAASRQLVEALKQRAPIWKRPIFAEDTA
jgi:molybdopterin synthase catalytic subunit